MNRKQNVLAGFGLACLLAAITQPAVAAGDASRGAKLFQHCAACHSLNPERHMTGPSLAGFWGRKAGTAGGFGRYSDALRNSDVVWNDQTLDQWLRDPGAFIPGNQMSFQGMRERRARDDLIAFLKAASEGKDPPAGGQRGATMAQGEPARLKEVGPDGRLEAIRYCGDTYHVTTRAGKTFAFWEFNLRFKTDSGADGPVPGQPVLIRAGMMGDRAFVVFSSPEEMVSFIKSACP